MNADTKNNEIVTPLHEWVLVQVEKEAVEKTRSGIYIARDDKKHPRLRAKVLAVGPGEWKDGMLIRTEARPGDIVILQRHNLVQGTGLTHESDDAPSLVPQSEIIAIVRKATDSEPHLVTDPETGNVHVVVDNVDVTGPIPVRQIREDIRQRALADGAPLGGLPPAFQTLIDAAAAAADPYGQPPTQPEVR